VRFALEQAPNLICAVDFGITYCPERINTAHAEDRFDAIEKVAVADEQKGMRNGTHRRLSLCHERQTSHIRSLFCWPWQLAQRENLNCRIFFVNSPQRIKWTKYRPAKRIKRLRVWIIVVKQDNTVFVKEGQGRREFLVDRPGAVVTIKKN
jgi:hypothetical protein